MVACDLGSNTFRVVELDCRTGERLGEYEKIVRLAEGLSECGEISSAALRRLLDALREAAEIFDFRNKPHRCVATAALRLAKNGGKIREEIYEKTGLHFEIIDAAKEARLTRLAVRMRLEKLKIAADSYVLLDLGGGSTELTLCAGERCLEESFDVGIVTMMDRSAGGDLERNIANAYRPLAYFFEEGVRRLRRRPERFVATAGTPTTVAAFLRGMDYENYDYRKVNGVILTRGMLREASKRLLEMEADDRKRWVGVGREDLIIAGVMMLDRILALCGYEEMIVIDDGLREGAALEACGENLEK